MIANRGREILRVYKSLLRAHRGLDKMFQEYMTDKTKYMFRTLKDDTQSIEKFIRKGKEELDVINRQAHIARMYSNVKHH